MARNIVASYDFKTSITVQALATFNANISAFGTSTFWANQQLSLAVRNGVNAVTNLVEYSANGATVLGGRTTNGLLWAGTTSAPTLGHAYNLTSAAYVSTSQATFTASTTRSTNPYAVNQKIIVSGVTGGTYNGSFIITAIGGSSGAWTATVTSPSGTTPFTNTSGTGGTGSIESAAFIKSLSEGSAPLTLQLAGASGTSTDFLRMYDGSNNLRTYFSGAGDLVVPAISATWSITSSAQDVSVNAMRTRTSLASGYRANLQTWESSSTVLAGMTSAGKFFTGSTIGINSAVGGTIQSIATGANPLVTMASAHGLAVGDVVVLAGTTSGTYNGTFFVATTPAATTFTITSALTAGQAGAAGTVSVGAQVAITARSAGIIGLIVRGVASQSADLQQWQNSSGTATSSIAASGLIQTSTGLSLTGINSPIVLNSSMGSSGDVLTSNGTANTPTWLTSTGSGNNVRATSPTFATSIIGSASMDVFNTVSTTINAFGAATTMNLGTAANTVTIGQSGTLGTGTNTFSLFTGSSTTGTTQNINIGTGQFSLATQNINIGTNATSGLTATRNINIGTSASTGATTTTTINGTLVASLGKKVIQTVTLSGTSAISFTSIPAGYRDLEIRILATTAVSTSTSLTMTVNGLTTNIYATVHQYVNGVSPSTITYSQQTGATSANLSAPVTFGATASSSLTYTLNDYRSDSFKNGTVTWMGGPSSGTYYHGTGGIFIKSTAAITQIDIAVGGTGGITGSAVLIGVY